MRSRNRWVGNAASLLSVKLFPFRLKWLSAPSSHMPRNFSRRTFPFRDVSLFPMPESLRQATYFQSCWLTAVVSLPYPTSAYDPFPPMSVLRSAGFTHHRLFLCPPPPTTPVARSILRSTLSPLFLLYEPWTGANVPFWGRRPPDLQTISLISCTPNSPCPTKTPLSLSSSQGCARLFWRTYTINGLVRNTPSCV